MNWQPISTAPKDGAWFLAFRLIGGNPMIEQARWRTEKGCLGGVSWSYPKGSDPTHWMPLPDPPPQATPSQMDAGDAR